MKVMICGLSPGRNLPGPMGADLFKAEGWEIWGLPWDPEIAPHANRLFELHPRDAVEDKDSGRRPDYIKTLGLYDAPVYMQQGWDDIENSLPYPLEAVALVTGDYFGSSIAYMLALAIVIKASEIRIWGVEVADPIYDHQRPNLEYLIGFARGKGVTVTVDKPSNLLKHRNVDRLGKLVLRYPERYGWT